MNNDKPAVCPIKGCNLQFSKGILGWHKHVERTDAHPHWHPELTDAEARKTAFVDEFRDWFQHATGHQTPAAVRLSTPRPPPRNTPGEMPAIRPLEAAGAELRKRILEMLVMSEGMSVGALPKAELRRKALDLLLTLEE